MKQSRQGRTPSELSEAVNHKLALYALAASSAGVGLVTPTCPYSLRISICGDATRHQLALLRLSIFRLPAVHL